MPTIKKAEDGAIRVYDADDTPYDGYPVNPKNWKEFRKTALTRAMRVTGPFTVETSEGPLTCADGWLAVDARGYPYPVAADEFEKIYVEAVPEDIDEHEEEIWVRSTPEGSDFVSLVLTKSTYRNREHGPDWTVTLTVSPRGCVPNEFDSVHTEKMARDLHARHTEMLNAAGYSKVRSFTR